MNKFTRTSHYISELLFQHDCVIVPDFGGFVCSYAPAKVHPAQHLFTPPSKQVFFNRHLIQNDGLLAHCIADASGCTFEDAMKDVRLFVEELKKTLSEGRKAELPLLGTFSTDPEGNLVFESDPEVNFLMDSFGLSAFQSMPVIREAVKETVVKETEPVVRTLQPETETPEERSSGKILKVAAALAIPLLAASLFFVMNNSTGGNGLAGLGFFKNNAESRYQPVQWFKPEQKEVASEKIQPDTKGNYTLKLSENGEGVVVNIHKAAPDSTRVELQVSPDKPSFTEAEAGTYYVIGGCFSVPENVENYRKLLISKGYKPVILNNVKSKLTHISLAGFESKEKAVEFLNTIRTDIPEAWVLKR